MAGNPLRYRRQILALKQFFAGRNCTVIAARRHDGHRSRSARAEHRARRDPAAAPQSRVRRRAAPPARRQVSRHVVSRRLSRLPDQPRAASRCSRGWSPPNIAAAAAAASWPSSIPELDDLLGGGIEEGTSTLIVGAAGTGKSTIAAQFCVAAASARREVGHVHVRREPEYAVHALQRPRHRPRAARDKPARSTSCRSIRRSCRPASSRT